ncbi:MAG: RDD family protein, partial [Sulfurimonas sp.]|nr:RDD family protein [Sulfurimonas sp.]
MNEEIENLLHREGMTLATIKKRGMAFFIDEMLLSLLLILALGNSFFEAKTVEEMILLTNTFILEYMAIKIIYQAFFIMQYGATLGKIAMKLRVIEIKTLQTPNVVVALNRAFVRVV